MASAAATPTQRWFSCAHSSRDRGGDSLVLSRVSCVRARGKECYGKILGEIVVTSQRCNNKRYIHVGKMVFFMGADMVAYLKLNIIEMFISFFF